MIGFWDVYKRSETGPFVKVQDFDRWKAAFDEQTSARAAAGSKRGYIFRNLDDGNEVVVLLEWDEREKVQEFIVSKDMQQTMLDAGVAELPTVYQKLDSVGRPDKGAYLWPADDLPQYTPAKKVKTPKRFVK